MRKRSQSPGSEEAAAALAWLARAATDYGTAYARQVHIHHPERFAALWEEYQRAKAALDAALGRPPVEPVKLHHGVLPSPRKAAEKP
jgi:hypothetical protein